MVTLLQSGSQPLQSDEFVAVYSCSRHGGISVSIVTQCAPVSRNENSLSSKSFGQNHGFTIEL